MIANAPENWKIWIKQLSKEFHGRSKWRLEYLFFGIIFAQGKKTVTSWLRAAGITKGYQEFYTFLTEIGKKKNKIAQMLLEIVF